MFSSRGVQFHEDMNKNIKWSEWARAGSEKLDIKVDITVKEGRAQAKRSNVNYSLGLTKA